MPRVGKSSPPKGKRKEIKAITDLVQDDHNPNAGTARGLQAVDTSLERYGAGRSIVVDAAGRIIAGNKTASVAARKGLPVRVVETDGQELVVVQRTDLDLEDPTGAARGLSVADNRAGELGLEWDAEELKALDAAGLDMAGLFMEEEIETLTAKLEEPTPPQDFKEINEALETDHTCPKCGYQWSGGK
jgi:hypothetical protein